MSSKKSLTRVGRGLVFLSLVLVCWGKAQCQQTGPLAAASTAGTAPADDYKIGPGDIITVSMVDTPELGGRFRISESGMLELPALAAPIHADGQTPQELARTIRRALIDAGQVLDPKVSVFVEQFHGRTITVLGAVQRPSVYPLERHTTVLEALSMAGGLLPTAGNVVTIIRGPASAEASNTAVGSVEILDMGKLAKGQDLGANVEVQNGDVVTVTSAAVVYVVGAVTKPGGYVMPDPGAGISVVQALAMAQGFTPVASTHHGLIVRESSSDTKRQEIPIDTYELMTGKATDIHLAPNDILFIPESGTKKTMRAMGDVAMAAVNGAAIYGLGYRIGGLH